MEKRKKIIFIKIISRALVKEKFILDQFRIENKSINNSHRTKKLKNNLEDRDSISTNISNLMILFDKSNILNTIETANFDIFNLDNKTGKENTLL